MIELTNWDERGRFACMNQAFDLVVPISEIGFGNLHAPTVLASFPSNPARTYILFDLTIQPGGRH